MEKAFNSLQHTIATFDVPGKESHWKNLGKGEKANYLHFLFPQYYLTFQKRLYQFWICCVQILLFRLVQNLLWGKGLKTLDELDASWKDCWKKRECCITAFSQFPKMFYTLPKTNFNFLTITYIWWLQILRIWFSLKCFQFKSERFA